MATLETAATFAVAILVQFLVIGAAATFAVA